MNSSIPNLPGLPVDADRVAELKTRVKDLLRTGQAGYFVCEKTDGLRVLVLIVLNANSQQEVYLIDRKNTYRFVPHIEFPVPGDNTFTAFQDGTIFDGELVLDREADGSTTLRLLAFDCLAFMGKSLLERPLTKRLGYLCESLIKPYSAYRKTNPDIAAGQPFVVEVKQMELSYGVLKVFDEVIPKLKHKNDGLIFTSSVAEYIPGTCEKILKWKPAHENSIDLLLEVQYPKTKGRPDYTVKPRFILKKWVRRNEHTFFSEMTVTDEEWENTFRKISDLNGRIVETVYDPTADSKAPWKFLRFRDDKQHANHSSVVTKIQESIRDAVTKEQLIAHAPKIRDAWKRRETQKSQIGHAQPSSSVTQLHSNTFSHSTKYSDSQPEQSHSHSRHVNSSSSGRRVEHTEKSSFSRPQQPTPPTPKGKEDGHSEQNAHDYRMRPLQQPTPPSPQTREDNGRLSGNRMSYVAGKRLPSGRAQSHTRRKLQGDGREGKQIRPKKSMRRTTSSSSSSSQNVKYSGRSRTERPNTPYSDPASSSPSPESTTYSPPVVSTRITSSSKRGRFGRKTIRIDALPQQMEYEGNDERGSSSESESEEEDNSRRSKYRRIERVGRV
ncbi:7346_t:CDS:2 [Paraglomus occultum]|uniref:mRNA guanylyltransferase n=1 Tax=Paraglomus occultum TaxID=144539 RepID=A0A9N8ZXG6_9GLOM|nr:7346_t:CDS:2 [Paraglomus occultum]